MPHKQRKTFDKQKELTRCIHYTHKLKHIIDNTTKILYKITIGIKQNKLNQLSKNIVIANLLHIDCHLQ